MKPDIQFKLKTKNNWHQKLIKLLSMFWQFEIVLFRNKLNKISTAVILIVIYSIIKLIRFDDDDDDDNVDDDHFSFRQNIINLARMSEFS